MRPGLECRSRRLGRIRDVASGAGDFSGGRRTARNFDSSRGPLELLSGIARHHVAQYYRKEQRQTRIVRAVSRWARSTGRWWVASNGTKRNRWSQTGYGGNGAPDPSDALESLGRLRRPVDKSTWKACRPTDGRRASGLGDGRPFATGPRATSLRHAFTARFTSRGSTPVELRER